MGKVTFDQRFDAAAAALQTANTEAAKAWATYERLLNKSTGRRGKPSDHVACEAALTVAQQCEQTARTAQTRYDAVLRAQIADATRRYEATHLVRS